MSAYTSGPWEVSESRPTAVIKGSGAKQTVADVTDFWTICKSSENGERDANVRLIAAAPELLEALKALAAWQEAEVKHFQGNEPDGWIMDQVNGAIAKATGGARRYPRTLVEAFPQDHAACTEGWQRPNADKPVVIACVIILIILAICFGVQP